MAALPEELVEEIFLGVPPDEPALLVRAALVCKASRRILLSDGDSGGFLRRYRRFHKTPPLLGYVHNAGCGMGPRFVPTSSFSPPAPAPTMAMACSRNGSAWALDCRHGRVLIHTRDDESAAFMVWDPSPAARERLGMPAYTYPPYRCSWATAVLCAVDGYNHIDCHAGGCPFIVVFMEVRAVAGAQEATCTYCASVYSSRMGAWSAPAPHITSNYYDLDKRARLPSLVIGDALYFTLRCDVNILRYDLGRHRLSLVDTPPTEVFEPVPIETSHWTSSQEVKQLSKIGKSWLYPILPYMSFCTTRELAKVKFSPP